MPVRVSTLRRLRHLAPLALLAAALYFLANPPAAIDRLRLLTFDTYQQLAPRRYRPAPVRIVDIDDESLHRLGQWPWPRNQIAAIIARLRALGAAAIAFDVIFAEPDRTSPMRMMSELPAAARTPELAKAMAALPDHDQELAREIAKGGIVLAVAFTSRNAVAVPMKYTMPFGGTDPRRYLPSSPPGAVLPLPALVSAAAGLGAIAFRPDGDGIEHRVPLVFRQGSVLVPSLVAEALRIATGAHAIALKASDASGEGLPGMRQRTGIVAAKIGPLIVPTTADGRIWLHDTGHVPERFVPAWQIVAPGFDRRRIDGTVVFIGSSAAGLADIRPTPLDATTPGVEIHAEAAEQILLGDYLARPDWAPGAEFLFALAFGLVLIVLVELVPPLLVTMTGALAIGAVLVASWIGYVRFQFLTDPIVPSLIVLVVYLSSSGLRFLAAERERRWVRSAFGQYLSPVLVEQLAKAPERLALGGEMREVTLMFCDIRGFTTISERLDPHALTRFINGFLTPMTGIVLEHRGTIDKYIGDCLMAFWNAPLDDAEHARHACQAALAMNAALPQLRLRLAEAARGGWIPPLAIGIGLNSGPCSVGNMGSEQRFDYSALGDAVNLASRLESQSKTYGVTIVIAEDTRAGVPELAALELDLIRVKGKTMPVRIFTLIDDAASAAPEFQAWQGAHDRMLGLYRARAWDEALAAMAAARAAAAGRLATLYDLYAERLERCRAAPPPADWDGVYVAPGH
jgi:adenylate cyclase